MNRFTSSYFVYIIEKLANWDDFRKFQICNIWEKWKKSKNENEDISKSRKN